MNYRYLLNRPQIPITIDIKTVSPNENVHTFAKLSLTVRSLNNAQIENIRHFN